MRTLACSHILLGRLIFLADNYNNKARPKLLPNFGSVVRNCLVSEQLLLSPTFWLGSCTWSKNIPILSKTIASYFVRPAGKTCPGSFLFLLSPFARLGKTFFCSWILCFMPMWTAAESGRCGNLAPAAWWKNVRASYTWVIPSHNVPQGESIQSHALLNLWSLVHSPQGENQILKHASW